MAIPPEIPLSWIAVKDKIKKLHNMRSYMDWGKIQPNYFKLTPDWHFTGIAIHHSGNRGLRCPVCIEKEHRTRTPPNDHVGYHYLIDERGKFYEGRPVVYKGEHLGGANTGRIGILMMGDYDHQVWDLSDDDLPKAQLDAARVLIATLIAHFPIQVLGGHKEFMNHKKPNNYTCPGNVLMPEVAKLRKWYQLNAP